MLIVGKKSKHFMAEPQLGWQWLGDSEGEDKDEDRKMGGKKWKR